MVANLMLVEALTSVDQQQFVEAREAIVAIGDAAIPALIEAVQTATSDRDRWRVLLTLTAIGGPKIVPVMIDHLRSTSNAIRALAAQFLGQIGDRRAIDPMIEVLNEADDCCSPLWIINALGKLGDGRAVDPLIKFLHATTSSAERYTTIEALGLLGNPKAADQIRLYVDDPDHHVRDRVIIALTRLESPIV